MQVGVESKRQLCINLEMSTFFPEPTRDSAPAAKPVTAPDPIIPGLEAPIFIKDVSEETLQKVAEALIAKAANQESLPAVPDIYNLGPWSPSKLKTLQKCPFQFYLKYILKFKIPANLILQEDPTSAHVGTALHEILELIMIGRSQTQATEKVFERFVQKEKLLSEEQWTTRVMGLEYHVTQFKDRMDSFGVRNKVRRVYTELRIGITKDYESTSFFADNVWLRGVVDLILELENGDIVILDHKTGGGFGGLKGYESQLDWYKILFHYGIKPVTGAQVGVHFIGLGDVKMGSYSTVSDIETSVKNKMELTLEGAVAGLLETGFFKHARSNMCKWCEFDALGCKSGALKETEKRSGKVIPITLAK